MDEDNVSTKLGTARGIGIGCIISIPIWVIIITILVECSK
jgi:hypothetical protein